MRRIKEEKLPNHSPLILGSIFAVVILVFYRFLFVYFTGDDFFHFVVAGTDGTLSGFINLFGFHPFEERGIAFYRPLFRDGLYHFYYYLFGLSVTPFRFTQLLLHFANISLVYVFIHRLFGKRLVTLFSTFFYAVTAAQVGSLYYLAGGIQAQGATLFMLASLVVWEKRKVLSFLFFILGLMSHELAIVTFVLLAGLELLKVKGGFSKNLVFKTGIEIKRKLWLFAVVAFLYLYLNFFVIGFSESEAQYSPDFSIGSVLNTLMWYVGWAIGLPEMLVDFVGSRFKLNPNLMRHWGDYFRIIFPAFFVTLGAIVVSKLIIFKNKRSILHDRRVVFLFLWIPLALLPVIFLPIHKKTYYLATALPAFWGLIGYFFVNVYEVLKSKSKIAGQAFLTIVSLALVILNLTSTKLSDETYWAAKRGRLAEKLLINITETYPKLPKGANIYIKNDPNYPKISGDWGGSSTQANYILNGSDALRLWYEDPTLNVYYEDLVEEDIAGRVLFNITAVID